MDQPKNAVHLKQFVCALQWVRSAAPHFGTIIQPLHEILEHIYSISAKRTKQAVAKIDLAYAGCNASLTQAFCLCKKASANQVQFSYGDIDKRLCLYCDAWEIGRAQF